ncbi:MAG TPA: SDR family oxidoreductase [Nitrospirae bacterium]|nr:SDR family oxidoreductase [Nitrospirota bacterium]
MKKYVFITGSESFIGKELISQCEANEIKVTGADLVSEETPGRFAVDIRSPGIREVIPESVDAVIHLAALSRDADCRDNAYECFDVNVMGTLNLMDAAVERGAKQFIFASTEWVYDSFVENETKLEGSTINAMKLDSEYALSKLVSEANLRQKYLKGFCDVMILRFGIIYGPRTANWSAVESLTYAVGTKDEVSVGSLGTARAFIHVSDIASGIIKSIGAEGFNTINLQGSRLISLGEVIKTAKRVLGKTPDVAETTPDSPSVRAVSGRKAGSLIDWRPAIDLETGLKSILPALGLQATE